MARLNLSVVNCRPQAGHDLPGFLKKLAVSVSCVPHFGQVTLMILSSSIAPPMKRRCWLIKRLKRNRCGESNEIDPSGLAAVTVCKKSSACVARPALTQRERRYLQVPETMSRSLIATKGFSDPLMYSAIFITR